MTSKKTASLLSPPEQDHNMSESSEDSSFDRKCAEDALNDEEENEKLVSRMKSAQEVSLAYSRELQKLGVGGSLAPAVWAKPIRSEDEKIKMKIEKVERLDHALEVLSSLERTKGRPNTSRAISQRVKRTDSGRDHPAVVLNLGLERRPSRRVAVLVDISESDSQDDDDDDDNNNNNARGGTDRKLTSSASTSKRRTAATKDEDSVSATASSGSSSSSSASSAPPPLPPTDKEHGHKGHGYHRRTDSAGGRSSPRRFHVKQGTKGGAVPPSSSSLKSVAVESPDKPPPVPKLTPLERCLSLTMQLHVVYEQLTDDERRACRNELSLLDGIESLAALMSGATARKLDNEQKTQKRESLVIKQPVLDSADDGAAASAGNGNRGHVQPLSLSPWTEQEQEAAAEPSDTEQTAVPQPLPKKRESRSATLSAVSSATDPGSTVEITIDAVLDLHKLPQAPVRAPFNQRHLNVDGGAGSDGAGSPSSIGGLDDGGGASDMGSALQRSSSLPARNSRRKSLAAGSAEPGTPKAMLQRISKKKKKIAPSLPSLNDVLKS